MLHLGAVALNPEQLPFLLMPHEAQMAASLRHFSAL